MNSEKKERFSKMLIQGVIALTIIEYLYLFIRYF
ncbi:TPA: small membrane protein YkgR [Escherichia coli]